MTVEAASTINDLVSANPPGGDSKSEGDNHIRVLKTVLKATFPSLAGTFGRVQSKTISYNLAATDNYTMVVLNGANLILGTAVTAATFGNGFNVSAMNFHSSAATFDPSGGELVNGASSVSIPSLHSFFAWCDGGQWLAIVLPLTPPLTIAPGIIVPYGGVSPPTAWLLCNGASYGRLAQPGLFAAIGVQYGAVDGNSFSVPNLTGRAVFGLDPSQGLISAAVCGINGAILGAAGGSQFGYAHNHSINDAGHGHPYTDDTGAAGPINGQGKFFPSATPDNGPVSRFTDLSGTGISINFAGSGSSQNMPPAMMLNYIIKT